MTSYIKTYFCHFVKSFFIFFIFLGYYLRFLLFYDKIITSNKFFARKFDVNIDSKILDMLDNKDEITQKELAKSLGISRSYVSRIEKRALTKILKEFIKNKDNC